MELTRAKLSSPSVICSTLALYLSSISSVRRSVSLVFMLCLNTDIIVKLRRPAMPVMKRSSSPDSRSTLSTIMVPGSAGALVFLMFSAMPFSFTGCTDSSCSTLAPMKASSLSSP